MAKRFSEADWLNTAAGKKKGKPTLEEKLKKAPSMNIDPHTMIWFDGTPRSFKNNPQLACTPIGNGKCKPTKRISEAAKKWLKELAYQLIDKHKDWLRITKDMPARKIIMVHIFLDKQYTDEANMPDYDNLVAGIRDALSLSAYRTQARKNKATTGRNLPTGLPLAIMPQWVPDDTQKYIVIIESPMKTDKEYPGWCLEVVNNLPPINGRKIW